MGRETTVATTCSAQLSSGTEPSAAQARSPYTYVPARTSVTTPVSCVDRAVGVPPPLTQSSSRPVARISSRADPSHAPLSGVVGYVASPRKRSPGSRAA